MKKIALGLWRIMLVLLIVAIALGAGYGIIRVGSTAFHWISGSFNSSKPAATQTATPGSSQPQTNIQKVVDDSAVKAAEAEAAAAKKAAEEALKKANESEAARKAAEEAQKKAEEAQKKAEAEKKAAEEAAKKIAPSIVSVDEQGLATNSITIKTVAKAGSSQAQVWVEYGTSSGNLSSSISKSTVSANNTDTLFLGVNNLSANTTYYYRVVASSNNGSDYSGVRSFKTSNPGSSQVAHAVSLFDIATWQNTDNNTYVKLTLGSLGVQPANRRVWIEQAALNSSVSRIYLIGTTSSYDTTPTFPRSNGTLFKLHIEGVAGEYGMTDVNRSELSDYTYTVDKWFRTD